MAKRKDTNQLGCIRVVGTVSDWMDNGQACFGLLLSFRTIAGRRVQMFVRQSELAHPKRLADHLVDAGLPRHATGELGELVGQCDHLANDHYTAVQGPGWQGSQYVWPDGSVVGKGKKLLLQTNLAHSKKHLAGTLKDWIRTVAKPARHSSPMIMATSMALGAYLLRDTGVEGGIIHLTSAESGAGKTLTQLVGQSVGRRADRLSLAHWDATDTSCEELAVEHNDGLLVLDEIARLAAAPEDQVRKAEAASFRMAGGVSRLRSRRYSPSQTTSWRVLVLSSGEVSITGLADRVGRRRLQGDSVRMIDLPAVRIKGRGVFDLLPSDRVTASVAGRLEQGVGKNYGVAGKAFVEKYLADKEKSVGLVKGWIEKFMTKSGVGQPSWERRFAARFALAYASAMLARTFKILPWSEGRLFKALSSAWADARSAVQGEAERTTAVLSRLKTKARSRLVPHSVSSKNLDTKMRDRLRRYGCSRKDKKGREEFLIRPTAFRQWVGEAAHPEYILRLLQRSGALVTPTTGKFTSQVVMPGQERRSRVYRISARSV